MANRGASPADLRRSGHTALEDLDALGLDKRPNSSISPARRSGSSIYTPDDLRNRAQASVAVVKVDALAPECDEGVPPRRQAPLVIENEPEEARTRVGRWIGFES